MNTLNSNLINIGGKRYSLSSDDDYLAHIGREFEPDMVNLFKSTITSNDTVLDIGANIGCTALLFSDIAKEVYAFEPSPSTFSLLEKNIQDNFKVRNVHLHNYGLGAEKSKTTLTYSANNRSGGFVSD